MGNRRIARRLPPLPLWRALGAVAICLSLAWPAHAAPTELARTLVQSTTERLLARLKSERAKIDTNADHAYRIVDETVMPEADMETISRLVLAKHWRTATAKQRQDFRTAFRTLLTRTYAAALVDQRSVSIRYLGESMSRSGRYVLVKTQIERAGGKRLGVTYRLLNGPNGPKLVDTIVEGVSLVATYRSSFNGQISEHGMSGLIDLIHAKTKPGRGATMQTAARN
ncbi:MAG: ABC transporter substrate-binding protein [Gammaproteobacteria bacterium]|nr:ABC transporter substrate-binding protein [Gammaproteobacteria bacterium]